MHHAAASKPVGTGRANSTRNESEAWGGDEGVEVRYEEYFVEHDVSTADARRAARSLNLEDGECLQLYAMLERKKKKLCEATRESKLSGTLEILKLPTLIFS